MTTRRASGLALLACLAGAGAALYAATRPWSVEVTERTGMSPLRTVHTGADLQPWVTALALVALAGAGALLATGGWLRRVLGGVLALAGAGVAAGAVLGRIGVDPGEAGIGGTVWPVVCAAGGAIIVGGAVAAARHGHRWPTMSSRYERRPAAPARPAGEPAVTAPAASDSGAAARYDRVSVTSTGDASPAAPVDSRTAWDALDRGDDPTMS